MTKHRRQALAKAVAGTVPIPLRRPELAKLALLRRRADTFESPAAVRYCLLIDQFISPHLSIRRTVDLGDVRAVFLPRSADDCDYERGSWFLEEEIGPALYRYRQQHGRAALGVAYLRENAATFMQVDVGLTAAESAEYYPPLATDDRHNHYEFRKPGVWSPTECSSSWRLGPTECSASHGCQPERDLREPRPADCEFSGEFEGSDYECP
jgi:hypothetical protein